MYSTWSRSSLWGPGHLSGWSCGKIRRRPRIPTWSPLLGVRGRPPAPLSANPSSRWSALIEREPGTIMHSMANREGGGRVGGCPGDYIVHGRPPIVSSARPRRVLRVGAPSLLVGLNQMGEGCRVAVHYGSDGPTADGPRLLGISRISPIKYLQCTYPGRPPLLPPILLSHISILFSCLLSEHRALSPVPESTCFMNGVTVGGQTRWKKGRGVLMLIILPPEPNQVPAGKVLARVCLLPDGVGVRLHLVVRRWATYTRSGAQWGCRGAGPLWTSAPHHVPSNNELDSVYSTPHGVPPALRASPPCPSTPTHTRVRTRNCPPLASEEGGRGAWGLSAIRQLPTHYVSF